MKLNFQRPTISWKLFSGRFINAVMTTHASSIAEYGCVAISNNFTLGSGIDKLIQLNRLSIWTLKQKTKSLQRLLPPRLKQSSKRALLEDFVDKTTDEAVKRMKSSTVSEFENKGNKIRYEANNSIMGKVDEAISVIEKGKIERCQEKLAEGKKIILKQQKLLRIADKEEGG